MSPAQQLAAGIDRLGLSISPDAQARLLAYLDLIVKWNRVQARERNSIPRKLNLVFPEMLQVYLRALNWHRR